MRRRGFTIIELTMVCGIIAVLLGIVITVAKGAIAESRANRRTAIFTVIQQGLLTYQAQKGDFPVSPGDPRTTYDKKNGTYTYTADEVRKMIRALVDESRKGNPLVDISALYVSRATGEMNAKRARGLDFMIAIRGTKQNPKKMKLGEMYFGYPEDDGTFHRPTIFYSVQTDSLTVNALAKDEDQNPVSDNAN